MILIKNSNIASLLVYRYFLGVTNAEKARSNETFA